MKNYRLLFFGVVLCLCSHRAYSLTLSDAETEVRRLIKDTATSATLQRYSDSILTSFLNQAQREVVTQTWCLQTSTGISLSASTTYYSLPSDLIAVKLIRLRDTSLHTRNLYETSYKAQFENNPDYERQTGPPMQYILRYSTSGGTNYQVCFLPIATSSSLGTVIVDYYKQSTNLVNTTDTLLDGYLILVPYHEVVVYQAVSKIKAIEGDSAAAGYYLQLYQASLSSMNSRLGERPNLNPGVSGATSSAFSASGNSR